MPLATNEISSSSSILFRIPARLADVRLLGISVHALFANLGFNDIEIYQLELAVTESANNIVKHAYQYKENVHMNMQFAIFDDRVVCTFVDKGKFENFLKNNAQGEFAADTSILPPDSRGISIICEVMDEVSYRRSGSKNILKLVKYLS
jgi:anti-sigma regulatory factor (Ser/Thr protein kinase)